VNTRATKVFIPTKSAPVGTVESVECPYGDKNFPADINCLNRILAAVGTIWLLSKWFFFFSVFPNITVIRNITKFIFIIGNLIGMVLKIFNWCPVLTGIGLNSLLKSPGQNLVPIQVAAARATKIVD